MPTRKISDERPCFHPEHNPPTHMVYEPGTYEHICPACHHKQVFHVRGIYLTTEPIRVERNTSNDEISYGAASPFPLPRSRF